MRGTGSRLSLAAMIQDKAALRGELPAGLSVEDIRGEVHCHSTWSDGAHSIEEMARAALFLESGELAVQRDGDTSLRTHGH